MAILLRRNNNDGAAVLERFTAEDFRADHRFKLSTMASRPTKMLLNPECENNEDIEQILRDLCKKIFAEQLDAWCRDPATWPNDRSFDVFCRWFDYHYHFILIIPS